MAGTKWFEPHRNIEKSMVSRSPVNTVATKIETGNLTNGIYILKISDGNGKTIRTEKIIIQK